jgi:hypothetical protein
MRLAVLRVIAPRELASTLIADVQRGQLCRGREPSGAPGVKRVASPIPDERPDSRVAADTFRDAPGYRRPALETC